MNTTSSTSFRERVRKRLVADGWIGQPSFSQCGEDLIIAFLFDSMQVDRPSYMDVGAHDPNYLNNTKLLSTRGSRGINIEANPTLLQRFQRLRPRDTNLNIGVVDAGAAGHALDFYVMSMPTMSTFSEDEARRLERETKIRIDQVLKIGTKSLHAVVAEHHGGSFPDLLSVDIEGLDELVVPAIAGCETARRPRVICIETLVYSESGVSQKKHDLIARIAALGYEVYADTFINTIFRRTP